MLTAEVEDVELSGGAEPERETQTHVFHCLTPSLQTEELLEVKKLERSRHAGAFAPFALGFTGPAPRDYVGASPLDQPETAAMAALTRAVQPDVTLSYHTQGEEIYWRFQDYAPPGAQELGERLARVSGYRLEDTPFASGFAGYKDWFLQDFRRPGYTIEAGLGTNPLPLSQFDEIYRRNIGILVHALP